MTLPMENAVSTAKHSLVQWLYSSISISMLRDRLTSLAPRMTCVLLTVLKEKEEEKERMT